ncbi:MAG: hypothetical protein ACPGVN_09155 [Alphaproteobacteria bacterium]
MKYIACLLSLPLCACVATAPISNATSTPFARTVGASNVYVNPNTQIKAARPNVDRLDMRVVGGADTLLNGNELRSLVSGRTVYSQKLTNASETQVGSFSPNSTLQVSTNGQTINGNWSIKGNQICYLLSGKEFCSSVHRSAYNYQSQPVYYFRRASGEPTVVITGIS